MRRFAKILSLILAMVVIVSVMVIPASATEYHGHFGDNLLWEYDSNTRTLTIYGHGDMENCTMSGEKPWETQENIYQEEIRFVKILDGVTSIGSYVFDGCSNMESVSIPASVQKINQGAFRYCESLTEVRLPEGLTSISNTCFCGCSQLSKINIPSTVKVICSSAFAKCYNLGITDLPAGLEKIEANAFSAMRVMDEMYIPKSVTEIDPTAFNNCTSMMSIEVSPENPAYTAHCGVLYSKDYKTLVYRPAALSGEYTVLDSVTEIGNYAFNSNEKMTGVKLPNGLVKIGDDAFKNCVKLESIEIPNSVKRIGTGAFNNCGIKTLTIPKSVERVGGGLALDCNKLTIASVYNKNCVFEGTYTFPKNVTIYGYKGSTAEQYAKKHENPFLLLTKFEDVKPGTWYYNAVMWAVDEHITTGTGATTFSPDKPCSRAQAVTFLWRAAGSPTPKSTANPFSDVKAGTYYYNAVLWAVENGITSGMGKGMFGPEEKCTRSQIVTFLYRMDKKINGSEENDGNDDNPFEDIVEGKWYYDAVLWAVKNGITTGTSKTKFSPDDICTRAQSVTFLYRYSSN